MHEVKATDASERKGQVNEVDVSSISLVSGSGGSEMQAVGQPMHRRRRPIITSRSNCRIRGALAEIARTCALSEHGGSPTFALTLAIGEKRVFRQGRTRWEGPAQARIED